MYPIPHHIASIVSLPARLRRYLSKPHPNPVERVVFADEFVSQVPANRVRVTFPLDETYVSLVIDPGSVDADHEWLVPGQAVAIDSTSFDDTVYGTVPIPREWVPEWLASTFPSIEDHRLVVDEWPLYLTSALVSVPPRGSVGGLPDDATYVQTGFDSLSRQ